MARQCNVYCVHLQLQDVWSEGCICAECQVCSTAGEEKDGSDMLSVEQVVEARREAVERKQQATRQARAAKLSAKGERLAMEALFLRDSLGQEAVDAKEHARQLSNAVSAPSALL